MDDVLNLIKGPTTLPSLLAVLEKERAALLSIQQQVHLSSLPLVLINKWSDRQPSDQATFTSLHSQLASLTTTLTSLRNDIRSIEKELEVLENDASRSALEKVARDLHSAQKRVAYLTHLKTTMHAEKELNTCTSFGKQVVAPMKQFLVDDMHLFRKIDKLQSTFDEKLHNLLSKELMTCIKTLDWPTTPFLNLKVVMSTEQALGKFQECLQTALLLDLVSKGQFEALIFRRLADPLVLRLKFHFQSSRPTNRIDKPEWYLAHIQNLYQTHAHFLEKRINSFLSRRDANFQLWMNGIRQWVMSKLDTDFMHCFSSYSKLRDVITNISNEDEKSQTMAKEIDDKIQVWVGLIHHLALQVTLFDEKSATSYRFSASVFNDFFGEPDKFEKWLDMEQNFASNAYKTMMNRDDAWSIPLEGSPTASGQRLYCPCNSATSLLIQLESPSKFFQHLKSTDHHLQIFETIHESLLEQYLIDTEYELEKWLVPAFTRFTLFQPTSKSKADVESCLRMWSRLHASLSYLEAAMRKWSDSPVYLSMAEKKNQNLNDSMFDDLLTSYSSVRDQIVSNVVACLAEESFMYWRQYERRKAWLGTNSNAAMEPESDHDSGVFGEESGPTPALYTGLTTLSRRLDLVKTYFGSDTMDLVRVLTQKLKNRYDLWFKSLGESEQLLVDVGCVHRLLE